ncbi:MAG: precorrin-3B synthase [Hyphomicrobium sp.]
MNSFEVKGWCPGALRPMPSGDGLVVRVRPHASRLSSEQATGIADAARAFGNGWMDLSSRANLQIRGVTEKSYQGLIAALNALGLIDGDVHAEARRNILVTPFWRSGDESDVIAQALESALSNATIELPSKFGFAVDCGAERVLSGASADVRIERGADGGIIVRADGAAAGRDVSIDAAVPAAVALAEWFATCGGVADGRGRMAAHIGHCAGLPDVLAGNVTPAATAHQAAPGLSAEGALVGLAFGQMHAETLHALAQLGSGLRLTPWRMLLIEDATAMPVNAHLITQYDDALLRVVACTGAPGCPQARGETRGLARALAQQIRPRETLHVSGCAKGCAHPARASFTLVASGAGYDLIRDGRPGDAPLVCGLTAAALSDSRLNFLGDR